MAEQILAIFIVLGLLAATLWFLRRKGLANVRVGFPKRSPGPRQIEILERIPLTPSHSLHLIRVQGRLILVGVSPGSCALVESFDRASKYGEP